MILTEKKLPGGDREARSSWLRLMFLLNISAFLYLQYISITKAHIHTSEQLVALESTHIKQYFSLQQQHVGRAEVAQCGRGQLERTNKKLS